MKYEKSLAFAKDLDQQDSLQKFRNEFIIPAAKGKEKIYFLGNSLGLQPRRTHAYLQQVMEQWSQLGVEGFFHGPEPWYHYHDGLTKPLAGVVGALPEEVVVMNQLTVNLHLMLATFYRPEGKRTRIICEAKAFPSDQYMLETHIRHLGLDPDDVIIEVQPVDGTAAIDHKSIIAAIREHSNELALVFWGGVNYYSGQAFDLKAITEAAHQAGARVGFDLAHAAGNMELQLHNWEVDFACWCSYKYLNSGPGAIAGVFVHQRHHKNNSLHRLAGWWGYNKETRFRMQKGFEPVPTAEGWQVSTPSPLLYAAHKAALELFEEAGMQQLLEKSRRLTGFLLFLLQESNKELKTPLFQVITPAGSGCQVSILVQQNGRQLFEYLAMNDVFADWREPDVIRIAPVPLYNTFEEVYRFNAILMDGMKELLNI